MEAVIIDKAKDLFFRYGLKSVSMDDLAKNAGISKKTIYQSFADKEELVMRIVEDLVACHHRAMAVSVRLSKDAVEEVVRLSNMAFNEISGISIGFFYELEKAFPETWQLLMQHRKNTVQPLIVRNIERGIMEKFYRPDLDSAFIAEVRLQQLTTALDPSLLNERRSDRQKLMLDLTAFYLHGIVNARGNKLINKYLNKEDAKLFIQ
jgi:AcrR family transcriptional regulator